MTIGVKFIMFAHEKMVYTVVFTFD